MRFRRLAPVAIAVFTAVAVAGGASASCDTAFAQQWNLQKIAAPSGWNASTGTGVTVGVVDSGADSGHPDLVGRITTYDCTLAGDACGPAGSGTDQNGHGTHVSGIIGAAKDNNEGIAGVAPEAKIVVAKVFVCEDAACENPGASFEDVVAGVNKVLAAGAKVVNLSLGDGGVGGSGLLCNNSDFKTLLNDIWEKGKAVPVFAAGNCGSGLLGGGSDFRDANALIVGATGPNDSVANYSSSLSGSKWGVVAPGGGDGDCGPANCILSTWPQSKIKPGQAPYAWLHGTSMAAPHVAGAMAAILARQPDRSAAVSTLLANLDKIACGDGCQGRLNLAKALGVANTAPAACKASTPNPTVGPSGTTATTRRRASSAPRTTAAPAPTGPDLSETELPTTTEVTEDTAVVADDEFETAQVPSTPERPSDDDVNGPLAVLGVLGVLGVGGTAAPLVWRRFMHPG